MICLAKIDVTGVGIEDNAGVAPTLPIILDDIGKLSCEGVKTMLRILSELRCSQKMVSIYTDYQETNKFHYGVIIALNEKEVAIQMLSPDGESDGIIVMDVENVFRVEENGQYDEKMKKLCPNNPPPLLHEDLDENEIFESLLSIALIEKSIVSIELVDSGYNDIVGFVEAIEDGRCRVKQVNEYGYEDGFSFFLIRDITKITYLSQDEKRLMKLWQLSKN